MRLLRLIATINEYKMYSIQLGGCGVISSRSWAGGRQIPLSGGSPEPNGLNMGKVMQRLCRESLKAGQSSQISYVELKDTRNYLAPTTQQSGYLQPSCRLIKSLPQAFLRFSTQFFGSSLTRTKQLYVCFFTETFHASPLPKR